MRVKQSTSFVVFLALAIFTFACGSPSKDAGAIKASPVTTTVEVTGGAAVSVLAGSPAAKGLFHKAICMSGGSFGPLQTSEQPGMGLEVPSLKVAEAAGEGFIKRLGVADINEARALSAEDIQKELDEGMTGIQADHKVMVFDEAPGARLLPGLERLKVYDGYIKGLREKKESSSVTGKYSITPVDMKNVKLTDRFWLPIIRRVQEKTIPYAIKKCEDEGRLDNFLIAGGEKKGSVKGKMPFDDTDVYKIIEGASMTLISAPNPDLEKQLDNIISIIGRGQEADGYLTTWRTINPKKPPAPWVNVIEGKRWESLEASHELYNAGHLYEAAYAHYKATGKTSFLNIAYKNADLMVKTFGDDKGQIAAVPGHQIIETGLIKLYVASGREEYLRLARYFLDNRGRPEHHKLNDNYLSAAYSQDHLPVIEQDEVVGHAVRAMYMYAAMTDIAVLMKDADYEKAVDNLWKNMTGKKIYLTGGIGARHEGEAFGDNYELPNLTAYNETCAAIGSVYWNHRLHCKTGMVKYLDVLERTLYNGLLSGLSLDGTHFFYPNPLESDGEYAFNQGALTRKDWFDCSCCPTNLIRFLPSLPGLIYSQSGNTLYVNLYAASNARVSLEDTVLNIQQETDYPWDGRVRIKASSTKDVPAIIRLRIPYWVRNEVLPGSLYACIDQNPPIVTLNGEKIDVSSMDGYLELKGYWKNKEITLEFPMTVRRVTADPEVVENQGKTALEYGPLVYAFEEVDQNRDLDHLSITSSDVFTPESENDLLGGVVTLVNEKTKAVPYYSWANRGVGKMRVWIPIRSE